MGLISSLKRPEEVLLPSLPSELMNIAVPPEDVTPKMLPI